MNPYLSTGTKDFHAASLVVEGGRCVVEAYYREETSVRHGKSSVVKRITKSPKTSCKAY